MAAISLLVAAALSGTPSPPATACAATSSLLEVAKFSPQHVLYPIDDPVGSKPKAHGLMVFEVHTNEQGNPTTVTLVCSTLGLKLVHAAERQIRTWQFIVGPPAVGPVVVSFSGS